MIALQLKREYTESKELRNLSGFGWDDERKVVLATADVWEAYLAVCLMSSAVSLVLTIINI